MNTITNLQLLKRVDDFLTTITTTDRVCIVHDVDPDGICSATIIAKCIERLRGKKIDLAIPLDKKNYGLNDSMIKKIQQKKITKLITVDFSAEQKPDALSTLEQTCKILIIDHHKLYSETTSPQTILYKPQLFSQIEPARYCTAKLAFDAVSRVIDASDLDWIAAAACIADIATEPWKDWLSEVFKKYNAQSRPDLFQTLFGQIAVTISSTEVYDQKLAPKCFKMFYQSKKPEDIINSPLGKYKKIIDKELHKHLHAFLKSEKHGELRIYEMTSPYSIHSPLSTILGLKYPHNTIIIINTTKPFIKVSARRGDQKIAVNTLLEECIAGFEGSNAGGHIPAAGAGFPKKYLKQFKQRIIEEA